VRRFTRFSTTAGVILALFENGLQHRFARSQGQELRSSGGQYLFANIMAKWFNLE
jgi:hypothetical protein